MTTSTLTAFYSVSSDSDPIAQARYQARVYDYRAWRSCLPSDYTSDEPRDWTEHAATLTRSTGHTKGFIADNLDALYSLDQLPSLRQLVEELHHIEMRQLRFISSALLGIPCDLFHDPGFWEIVDEELTDLFTATRPQQLLPDNRAISTKINGLVRVLHTPEAESGDPEAEDPEVAEPDSPAIDFWSYTRPEGTSTFELTLNPTTSIMVHEAIREQAKKADCSQAQAMADLILGRASIKVSLNLYRALDVAGAPGYLTPHGWLTPAATEQLAEMATISHDMDAAAEQEDNSYQPSKTTTAFVEGRDGRCRWPGCTQPATRSQKDHRINYEDGGPTTASNLVCICQHHHNRKTDKQIFYLLDEITGDVYWLFNDGTWACDEARGPLAPQQRHWVQTLAQRRERRHERARKKHAPTVPAQDKPVGEEKEDADLPPPF